jgi:hypothetical protein
VVVVAVKSQNKPSRFHMLGGAGSFCATIGKPL